MKYPYGLYARHTAQAYLLADMGQTVYYAASPGSQQQSHLGDVPRRPLNGVIPKPPRKAADVAAQKRTPESANGAATKRFPEATNEAALQCTPEAANEADSKCPSEAANGGALKRPPEAANGAFCGAYPRCRLRSRFAAISSN